jgi:DNA repair exonuclease SbcCD ATPase subunit
VPTNENFLTNLPDDKEALKAMLHSLWQERERQEKRAEEYLRKAEEQRKRADELYLEKLRLQMELERYKKATYGPRADRLSMNQLAQMLLELAETLEQKPINLEDLRQAEPEPELRRVKRRKGRRALANFENLPAQTHVYELSAEERPCPSCGVERKEIGSETLLRWYVLHVLALPFVLVLFLAVHFWRIRKDGGISGPL